MPSISSGITRLTDWVEKWAPKLKINHIEYSKHELIEDLTGLKFFKTSLSLNNRTHGGFGYDIDPELALLKSIAECIERSAALEVFNLPDSSGCACHTDKVLSLLYATDELYERDSLFTHFLTKTPFKLFLSSELPSEVQTTIQKFNKHQIKVDFFQMHSRDPARTSVLCRFKLEIEGVQRFIFATANNHDLSLALNKAHNEALSLTNQFLLQKMTEFSLKDDALIFPWQQQKLFFAHEHSSWFESVFFKKPIKALTRPRKKTEIDSKYLSLNGSPFESCGLYFSQATSAQLQRAFWGFPQKENVNLNRLSELDPSISEEQIPWNRYPLFG